MTDIRTELDGATFAVRAALLCQRGDKLLVEGGDSPFFNLPGGAVTLGETLQNAAAREWHEETGQQATDLRPVGLVENFFELAGRRWHELGFYYALTAPESLSGCIQNADNAANYLDWICPAEAAKPIYPTSALSLLGVPAGKFRHMINREGTPAPGHTLSPDLRFDLHGTELQIRVHLLYVQGGRLLTNIVPGSGFWFLPGGSVALHEDSHAAAQREFREETGVEAISAWLVGVTEGFDPANRRQQLGLCYRVEAAQPLPVHSYPVQDHAELWLEWLPLEEVESREVQPLGLSQLLDVPEGQVEHLILRW